MCGLFGTAAEAVLEAEAKMQLRYDVFWAKMGAKYLPCVLTNGGKQLNNSGRKGLDRVAAQSTVLHRGKWGLGRRTGREATDIRSQIVICN